MTFSIAFRRFVTLMAPISLAAILAACGATQAEKDNATPVEKLYADAMDDVEGANYDRAIKSLDRIEGRAAGSILAQQAQLELAYLYWKTSDKVNASGCASSKWSSSSSAPIASVSSTGGACAS